MIKNNLELRTIIIHDKGLLVHSSGAILDSDMTPIQVDWEEHPSYEYFWINNNKVYVHRVVADCYVPKPKYNKDFKEQYAVIHIDSDVGNNRASNLRHITREEWGLRRAKIHDIQHNETGRVSTIKNWYGFKEKHKYILIKTYNKDQSVSYTAPEPKTRTCSHIECTEPKSGKHTHCNLHRSELRRIKRQWKIGYNNINFKEDEKELLRQVKNTCQDFGVHSWLQLPDPYTAYDIKTSATLTNLQGEVDNDFTDQHGMDNHMNEVLGRGE